MNGDVIRRIKQYKDIIGHYHTAGCPGRGEIDDTQEINYPPILKTILDTGYEGYGSGIYPYLEKPNRFSQTRSRSLRHLESR